MQRFFVQDWPARLWFLIVPLAIPICVWWLVRPWLVESWLNWVIFAGVLLLAWVVGRFGAIIPGWIILGPLYFDRGLKNGAPYIEGDVVRILSGRYRNREVRVWAIWADRNEVRVELGDEARNKVDDVFGYYQVCRVTPGVSSKAS